MFVHIDYQNIKEQAQKYECDTIKAILYHEVHDNIIQD